MGFKEILGRFQSLRFFFQVDSKFQERLQGIHDISGVFNVILRRSWEAKNCLR